MRIRYFLWKCNGGVVWGLEPFVPKRGRCRNIKNCKSKHECDGFPTVKERKEMMRI